MNAAALAAANRRFLNTLRSSMGARERRSMKIHAGSSAAAAARPPSTIGSFQPLRPPRETPSTSPVKPIRNALVPSTSKPRTVSGFASSRSTRAPHAAPASASGTLNQNTQCQEIATSAPPRTGPSTRPIAAIIVLAPIASPNWRLGKASVTSAAALANRKAEPMPCRTRHRISAVASPAKPAPREASANTTKPPTYARLRPNRSLRRPAFRTRTVAAMR